jgi:hypothetical protein
VTGSLIRPPDIDLSIQPPHSRSSTLSPSPTSILFTANKCLSSENNESPFQWNLPSPVEPEENGSHSGGGRGQLSKPTAHIWRGWRIVVFGLCECITVYLFLTTSAKLDRHRVQYLTIADTSFCEWLSSHILFYSLIIVPLFQADTELHIVFHHLTVSRFPFSASRSFNS